MRILPVLIQLLLSFAVSVAWAGEGELSFCHFGPKMKIIEPITGEDGCNGSAKIQALSWECNDPSVVDSKVSSFLKSLTERAAAECEEHCHNRGRKCKGTFIAPKKCGLDTNREDAIALGKRLGCRKDCSGPALIYCSLYDAGFRTDDAELIPPQKPNCICKKG